MLTPFLRILDTRLIYLKWFLNSRVDECIFRSTGKDQEQCEKLYNEYLEERSMPVKLFTFFYGDNGNYKNCKEPEALLLSVCLSKRLQLNEIFRRIYTLHRLKREF